MPFIRDYITVWYVRAPFLMLTISGSTALRAIGDIKSSALLLALLSLINVILDPLLIFGAGPFPRLGVPGAACGNVLASVVAYRMIQQVCREQEIKPLPEPGQTGENS